MIERLKSALRALEAVKYDYMGCATGADHEVIDQTIADLHSVIAEMESAEPVAYLAWRDGKPCYEGDDAVCEDAVWPVDVDDDRTSMPVYLHPQPKAEPCPNGNPCKHGAWCTEVYCQEHCQFRDAQPKAEPAAAPQAKPLTDEQIELLFQKYASFN